jgi:outer membrane protein
MWMVASIFLESSLAAQDEPEMKVSLRQCVHLSLNNGESLEVSRYGPWISNETLLGSYGAFDWIAFAEGSSSFQGVESTSLLTGSGEFRDARQSYALGVRRLFPSGLLAEARVSASRQDTNLPFATLNPNWNNRAGLTLSLPLLRNAGEEFNTLTIVANRLRRDMSLDDFEIALQEGVFGVQAAYLELVFARGAEGMAAESLALARQLARESQQRFEQGLIARVQVTEAQAQVAAEQQTLLAARQAHLDAMDRLKRLIDPRLLSLERDTRLSPADAPMDFEGGPGFDERAEAARGLEEAAARRADVRRARRAVQAQELIRQGAENQLRPRLDLRLGAGAQGVSGTFPDAADELGSGSSRDWMFAFSFEMPLENRKAEADARVAELERRRLEAARRDLEGRVTLEVREAVRRVKTQERSILAAREQARLAQERLDAEQSRFREGLTTTYFVNFAQTAVAQARLRELRARIDYTLAHLNFQRVTGRLLSDLGIDVRAELTPRR